MVKINVKNELKKNQTLLLLVPGIEYNEVTVDIAKDLSNHKKICYVTLNKTYNSLVELFKRHNVSTKNMVFIDGISKSLKPTATTKEDNVYFVSSPRALTELSIMITKLLKSKAFSYLILDSVTTLTIYEKKEIVAKFMASLVNKVKESDVGAVFYAVGERESDPFIKECCMFVDKAIELD